MSIKWPVLQQTALCNIKHKINVDLMKKSVIGTIPKTHRQQQL